MSPQSSSLVVLLVLILCNTAAVMQMESECCFFFIHVHSKSNKIHRVPKWCSAYLACISGLLVRFWICCLLVQVWWIMILFSLYKCLIIRNASSLYTVRTHIDDTNDTYFLSYFLFIPPHIYSIFVKKYTWWLKVIWAAMIPATTKCFHIIQHCILGAV